MIYYKEKIENGKLYVQCFHIKKKILMYVIAPKKVSKVLPRLVAVVIHGRKDLLGRLKKLRGQKLPFYAFAILPGGPHFSYMHLPLKK